MLTVYTAQKHFRRRLINNIDSEFEDNIALIERNFDKIDEAFLWEIDGAKPLWVQNTLFAIKGNVSFPLTDISCGTKTCMLAHHLPAREGYILTLLHCGQNAITSMFKHLDSTNIPLYLSNFGLQMSIKELDGKQFNINNKKTGSYFDLWNALALRE